MTQEVRQVGPGAGGLPPAVQALAQADFSGVAQLFANAGFTVALPAPGMLQVVKPRADAGRASVAVSVGVHGDETGPIEVLAHLLDALSRDASKLAVDLLVCVGNVDAIRAGKRFIDADLNRMFRPVRGRLAQPGYQLRLGVVGHQVRHDGKRGIHGRPDGRVQIQVPAHRARRFKERCCRSDHFIGARAFRRLRQTPPHGAEHAIQVGVDETLAGPDRIDIAHTDEQVDGQL